MKKDIFITDNRLTFTKVLEAELKSQGYNVVLASDSNEDNRILWNKNSPYALQHINIQLKNKGTNLETAIIIFDAVEYAKLYSSETLVETDKTCTELITAYANLALILQNAIIKQQEGRVIFVLRPDEENATLENFSVQVACAAFSKLGESVSNFLASKKLPHVQSLLVRLDNPDENSAKWICSQLELGVLTRTVGKWVKAGQRGLFAK